MIGPARRREGRIAVSLVVAAGLLGCDALCLGSEPDSAFTEPLEVAPGQRFVDVGAGWMHTCATGTSGAVYCWGKGETGATPDPVEVAGGPTFVPLSATGSSTCALTTDGPAMYWGHLPTLYGSAGAEWYGRSQVPAGGPSMVSIYGGAQHHCGLTSAGEAWCWGGNISGALGLRSTFSGTWKGGHTQRRRPAMEWGPA